MGANYSGCRTHIIPHSFFGEARVRICVTTDYMNVYVDMTSSGGIPGVAIPYWDWKMELQRYTYGRWETIGTRTGWLSDDSPSRRTFTNVRVADRRMRVKVTLYDDRTQVLYSNYWTR